MYSSSEAYEKYAPRPVENAEKQTVREIKETVLVDKGSLSLVKENGQLDMVFDPMTEIPTLSHQPKGREVNDSSLQAESLNDKLKQGKTELVEVLKETPVKDLRKALRLTPSAFIQIGLLLIIKQPGADVRVKTMTPDDLARLELNPSLISSGGVAGESPAFS